MQSIVCPRMVQRPEVDELSGVLPKMQIPRLPGPTKSETVYGGRWVGARWDSSAAESTLSSQHQPVDDLFLTVLRQNSTQVVLKNICPGSKQVIQEYE